jgi:hypothetical protein
MEYKPRENLGWARQLRVPPSKRHSCVEHHDDKAMIGRIVGGENPSHPSYFEVFACCDLGDSGVH